MSKHYHDYSKHSAENKIETPEIFNPVEEEQTVITNDPIPTPEEEPKQIIGTVYECSKLNIRDIPGTDGNIVCTVPAGTQLMIDGDRSTVDWVKVYTEAGLEGYCMGEYITIEE